LLSYPHPSATTDQQQIFPHFYLLALDRERSTLSIAFKQSSSGPSSPTALPRAVAAASRQSRIFGHYQGSIDASEAYRQQIISADSQFHLFRIQFLFF